MAVPDATGILTPGFTGTGADTLELFLKVFSGEVLTTFERMNRLRASVRRRVLKSGKVAQFPAIGKVTASYHDRGTHIISPASGQLLSNVDFGEQLIYIDKKLLAPVLFDELDQMMQHYEDRQEVATEIGRALATKDDEQLLQVASIAARTTAAPTSDHPLGKAIFDTAMESNIANLIKGLRVASQIMHENDIPEMERAAYVRPNIHNALIEDGTIIDRDFNDGSPNGSIGRGTVLRAYGMELIMSNNIPSSNVSTSPNQFTGSAGNSYQGDFQNTIAICMQKQAVGTAQLMGVRTSASFKDEYQAWFLLGKQSVGHGVLRPGAAIELSKSAAGAELTNAAALSSFTP